MGVGWGLHWWSGTMLWFPVCHSWKGPQGFYNNCGSIAAPTVATPIHASKSKHASKVRFPDWLQWRRLREMLCFAVVFGSYGTVWPGVVIMVCYGDDCALMFQFQFKVVRLVPPVVGLVGPAWCTMGWSGAGNDFKRAGKMKWSEVDNVGQIWKDKDGDVNDKPAGRWVTMMI